MKPIYLAFCLLLLAGTCAAQAGVAISTNGSAPHSSAMLDVQSTSKGFLLPRMTQAQRMAINNPSDGLLVFDTDAQRLFQYQSGVWRFLIDNSFWAKSGTRKWVYNGTDSVGIGTAAPSEKLHVVGNIKTSGRIDADGVIEGAGLSSLGALYVSGSSLLTGSVTGNSSASFGGNINSNTSMSINDPAGIFDFKNSGVDKGFIQLSGDNLRLGTYSSNAQGSLVVRTNGSDQVKIDDEGLLLQNNGKIMKASTGTYGLLPAGYGIINTNGNVIKGTGNFSAVRVSDGIYEIEMNYDVGTQIVSLTSYKYSVIVDGPGSYTIGATELSVEVLTDRKFRVTSININGNGTRDYIDARFSFVVYGEN